MLIILQRKTNFLKKTLPYWKNWKKTERSRNFLSKSETEAGKEETREVRAGEARKILEAEEIADKVGEVVEKLKKPSSN